ncbi:MAG: DUF4388 domain-containing protein [Kofleriaceae bacterium]
MHDGVVSTLHGPVRGNVSDRPWGLTLAALALDRCTAVLLLRDEGKEYRISFVDGTIVGAASPATADSPLRVALTTGMISTSQAHELKLRLKPVRGEREQLAVIAEFAQFSAERTERLREAIIERCAARTFSIDQGSYVLEDRVAYVGIETRVDVRAVVYLGVRMNLSEQRLAYDLRQLGGWFVLKPKTVDDLSGFGFTKTEVPIIEALRGGTNLAALEARHREIDPRTAQSVIYALAACSAVVCSEPPAVARVPPPEADWPFADGTPAKRHLTLSDVETAPMGVPAVRSANDVATAPYPKTEDAVPVPAAHNESGFVDMRPTTMRPNALAVHDVVAMILERVKLLDRGADHFAILGLPRNAPAIAVQSAYVEMARYLEPTELARLGIRDNNYAARRLFAQVCIAVTVLTDPIRRREYIASLA